ncbi:MAG: porin [Gammaproteobacteria bacterium]|nr:porin [Gammaproteobacteria bacterium]
MNKNIKLAVAGAVLALSATAANAGIVIPAGDWTLDIGGVVNNFYTNTRHTGSATIVGGYQAYVGGANDTSTRSSANLTTGLLPNYLSVSGSTRQNDIDVAFTISINPGSSTTQAGIQSSRQENRQAFLTFGDKSWGSVKLGKDLGIFASDAILNDMTLLGVGNGAGALAGNTTTIGGIGAGFIYADWKSQVAYSTPNFNGFQATVGLTQAWNVINNSGVSLAANTGRAGSQTAYEGKASYSFAANDVTGKVWVSGISQKIVGTVNLDDNTATAFDIGANINFAGFGLTGYYYDGSGIGTTLQFMDGYSSTGKQRDSDGGYVQATYVLPTKTKLGVAYGESNLDQGSGESQSTLVKTNERWTVGAYHPLTKHLNLVAEYNHGESENQAGASNKNRTVSLGGILFF